MKTVYLAGPIAGRTKGEANVWRKQITEDLLTIPMRGISPLRCEPIVGERYGLGYADPMFGTARAIASKNMLDVKTCDITLAFFPKLRDGEVHSLGTTVEIGWAHALGKPVIIVTSDDYVKAHPVINACAGWMLDDLDAAVEVIRGIFTDYVRKDYD